MNRIIQALENRTAELKAEEDAYRKESAEIRKETEQIRKETEQIRRETQELLQMNPFELYYRAPGTTEHVKVDVALDQLYKEIAELKCEVSALKRQMKYLEPDLSGTY
jgi:archaellum component FlaC